MPACSKPSPSGKTPILTKPAVIAAIRNCLSDEYFIREERRVQRVAAQLLCQNFRQRATVQKIVAELPASCLQTSSGNGSGRKTARMARGCTTTAASAWGWGRWLARLCWRSSSGGEPSPPLCVVRSSGCNLIHPRAAHRITKHVPTVKLLCSTQTAASAEVSALVSALLQDDTCAHALSGKKASEGLADVAELDPDVHCAWVAHRLKKMVDVGAVMLTERDARPVSDGAFVNHYATGLVASAHVEQGAASATTDASSDEEEEPEPQPQPIVFEPAAEMKRVTDMVRRFQKWNVVAPRGGEMLRLAVPSAASMTDEALTRANLSGQHITISYCVGKCIRVAFLRLVSPVAVPYRELRPSVLFSD